MPLSKTRFYDITLHCNKISPTCRWFLCCSVYQLIFPSHKYLHTFLTNRVKNCGITSKSTENQQWLHEKLTTQCLFASLPTPKICLRSSPSRVFKEAEGIQSESQGFSEKVRNFIAILQGWITQVFTNITFCPPRANQELQTRADRSCDWGRPPGGIKAL